MTPQTDSVVSTRRGRVALPVTVVALALLAGCSSGTPDARPQGAAVPTSAHADGHAEQALPDPGIAHVHGLGVDPADGVLYAATHTGVFALPEQGEPTRVADRMQDTMGFTVVGPRTFLGSGHPDAQKDPELPPRLGLLRSTDAARTWTPVSLTGEVDFHVLHAAHGLVYGWDSGTGALMVSSDQGETWQTRSRSGLRDFAVSPTDPDVLLATTEQGLVRSTDGGRSFAAAPGPALVVLTWQEQALFGLDTSGAVHASTDDGRSWERRGTLAGEPEALGGHDGSVFAAVRGKGIHASRDGGRTWQVRYSEA